MDLILLKEAAEKGVFYRADGETRPQAFCPLPLPGVRRFLALYRESSCWMSQKVGNSLDLIPDETQFLLLDCGEVYVLALPLACGSARASIGCLRGRPALKAETGDGRTSIGNDTLLYLAKGRDPYLLIAEGYREIAARIPGFRLRGDKTLPGFADGLGCCTYNALGDDLSERKLEEYLAGFQGQGVTMRFLIADIGWQAVRDGKLVSFRADRKKFPEGLKALSERLRRRYGLQNLLLWMTYNGYWRGASEKRFAEYGVTPASAQCRLSEDVGAAGNEVSDTVGGEFYPYGLFREDCGFVEGDADGFYRDLFTSLRAQGADGVKLDAICWIEAFSEGRGGRVEVMRRMLGAVEAAADAAGLQYLACSSQSNDFVYNSGSCAVARSSTDYDPGDPGSHAGHVLKNAFCSLFWDELVLCDWDMFQTSGKAGLYHAKARAVSGGPVYCTDLPGQADFSLLARLSTRDGRVGRCLHAARPTRDCLFFEDGESRLFKVFNENRCGFVVAAFHCGKAGRLSCAVRACEAGAGQGSYAVSSSDRGFLGVYAADAPIACELSPLEAEIFSFAPLADGCAVLGMSEKLNPLGYVEYVRRERDGILVGLLEEGRLEVYADRTLTFIPLDIGEEISYNKILTVQRETKLYYLEANENAV